jgi:hypothetical protein
VDGGAIVRSHAEPGTDGIIYAEKNEAGEIVWKLTEKGFAMEAAKNKKPS